MYARQTGPAPDGATGSTRRQQLRDLVDIGVVPGLVGYLTDQPVGWISLGPRADFVRLQRSPIMKPVDDADVWSIVCSYVAKAFRGQGLQHRLLAGALDYARDNGVRLIEAYPVDKPERSHDDFLFFGSRSLYERAGFREVVRRSPTRVVMRRGLRPRRGGRTSADRAPIRRPRPTGSGAGRILSAGLVGAVLVEDGLALFWRVWVALVEDSLTVRLGMTLLEDPLAVLVPGMALTLSEHAFAVRVGACVPLLVSVSNGLVPAGRRGRLVGRAVGLGNLRAHHGPGPPCRDRVVPASL